MDGQSSSSHQDQISLYGLFGDSSATLQGLSDHLSPSSLQRSPPCGSTYYRLPISSPVTVSPVKVGITSSNQQQGLLLSDLADRSPSAGSGSAAAICSHVSSDNIRCTYLVKRFGNRYCNQHEEKVIKATAKASRTTDLHNVTSTSISQTISFITPTAEACSSPSNKPQSFIKPVRAVRVDVKPFVPRNNGIDVADKGMSTGLATQTIFSSGNPLSTARFARKVGQQIKVATRLPTAKAAVNGVVNQSLGQNKVAQQMVLSRTKVCPSFTTIKPVLKQGLQNCSNGATTNSGVVRLKCPVTASEPVKKTLRVNVIKPPFSGNAFNGSSIAPLKVEPSAMKPQSGTIPLQRVFTQKGAETPFATDQIHRVTAASKSLVMDESTLKTLVEVLNSQSDMPAQEQISLLRSLGITVVQAPVTNNNITLFQTRKQSGLKGAAGNKKTAYSGVKHNGPDKTLQAPPLVTKNGDSHADLSGKMLPTALIRAPIGQMPQKEQLPHNGKGAAKRKQKSEGSDTPTKKNKVASANSERSLMQIDVTKTKTKHTLVKNKQSKVLPFKIAPTKHCFEFCIPPCRDLKLLEVPRGAPMSLRRYAELHNSEVVLGYDLLDQEFFSESDTGADCKMVKSRLMKKHIAKRKAAKAKTEIIKSQFVKKLKLFERLKEAGNFLACLSKQKNKCSRTVMHHEEVLEQLTKKGKSGRESEDFKCLNDFDLADPEIDLVCSDLLMQDAELVEKKRLMHTLKMRRLRCLYENKKKSMCEIGEETALLLESYKEDPVLTTQLLKSMLFDCSDSGSTESSKPKPACRQRCQLSNSSGLMCSGYALPYALYCKQHIWHCQSQCLYKLDPNMKPTADISPEPFVKRTRKRTKLLPLIKRYKKKKKRRAMQEESVAEATNIEDTEGLKQEKALQVTCHLPSERGNGEIVGGDGVLTECEHPKSNEEGEESDADDEKPSETSEEDLHLTGQEIMMSGVFDKLPEDLHDFDLFTTDKGAEELERALLLAASSPPPDRENKPETLLNDAAAMPRMQSVAEEQRGKTKAESGANRPECPKSSKIGSLNDKLSPDIIVYDAKSTDRISRPPPSLESFSQSQCVHYTFGSTFAESIDKKAGASADSVKTGNYTSEEELSPPLISAEDLQDIEGVLESLENNVDDANSPMFPSSPAADQYTSMLARQLSQEAETESLKQRLSTTSHTILSQNVARTTHAVIESQNSTSSGSDVKVSASLARSFSLPVSDSRGTKTNTCIQVQACERKVSVSKSLSLSYGSGVKTSLPLTQANCKSNSKMNEEYLINGVQNKATGPNCPNLLGLDNILPSVHGKSSVVQSISTNVVSCADLRLSHKPVSTAARLGQKTEQTPCRQLNRSTGTRTHAVDTPRKLAKKNSREHTQTMLNIAGMGSLASKSPLTKPQQSPNLLSSQILPLTLMQAPSQGGNIIKVIVPAGTVVNGSGNSNNSQQNMLLIPVNALVRSNMMPGNQNIPIVTNQAQPNHTVKTQLSSLQAGQQFFVVNNSSASTQPHLTLVQKPSNIPSGQQTLILNPVTSRTITAKSLFSTQPATTAGQKQATVKNSKQVLCNIKPNMSVFLNQSTKQLIDNIIPASMPVSISGKSNKATNASVKPNFPHSIAVPSGALSAKLHNSAPGRVSAQQLGIHKAQVKKPVKAKFDPVTKKYVPGKAKLSTDVDTMLKEKFNASTLSIQNKVQQINSVLSSLNSAKNDASKVDQKNVERNRCQKAVVQLPASNCLKPAFSAPASVRMPNGIYKAKSAPKIASVTVTMPPAEPAASGLTNFKNAITITVPHTKCDSDGSDQTQQRVGVSSSSACGSSTKSSISSGNSETSPGKATVSLKENMSSGTVHWNQTTTAGPEIAPTMAVPLFATASWPAELTVNGSIAGTNLPIVFPAHKISPSYQLSQRVIVGNIGSLGLLSAKKTGQLSSPTITISPHPKPVKATDSNKGDDSSSSEERVASSEPPKTSNAGLPKSSDPGTGTNVTTVVGTTMSPKLTPKSKSPQKFALIDHEGVLQICQAEGVAPTFAQATSTPACPTSTGGPASPKSEGVVRAPESQGISAEQ